MSNANRLALRVLPGAFAVCRLAPEARLPQWASGGRFSCVCRTSDELSIICEEGDVPDGVRAERDWRLIQVEGELDFGLVGVLAGLLQPLADASIPVMAISTFQTDYLLVKQSRLERAVAVLGRDHVVRGEEESDVG